MTKSTKDIVNLLNDEINQLYITIGQIIYIMIYSSVSIANLSLGVGNKELCPLQPKIPTWLIVHGAVGVAMNAINIIGVRKLSHFLKYIL